MMISQSRLLYRQTDRQTHTHTQRERERERKREREKKKKKKKKERERRRTRSALSNLGEFEARNVVPRGLRFGLHNFVQDVFHVLRIDVYQPLVRIDGIIVFFLPIKKVKR